jgi:hypothetical protein
MSTRQDLIKTIMRLQPSRSLHELEASTDTDLVLLKAKAMYEYERHNVNLFRKGHAFYMAKRKKS